jgi:hypothetical protein
LRIEKDGYTTFARELEIAKGEEKIVAITLRRDEPITPPTVPEATSNTSSNSTPPGSSRRSVTATLVAPPPLEEWLVGREILTVKQDGTAMFTKIQDALDALKPGQVVEVLDRGPYVENLVAVDLASDTGLISRVQSIVNSTRFAKPVKNQVQLAGHELQATDSFRLAGFAFCDTSTDDLPALGASLVFVTSLRDFTIEDCFFDTITTSHNRPANLNAVSFWANGDAVLQDSMVLGRIGIFNNGNATIQHNFCSNHPVQAITLGGTSSCGTRTFQWNVIDSPQGVGPMVGQSKGESPQIVLRSNTIRTGKRSIDFTTSMPTARLVAEQNIFVGQRRMQVIASLELSALQVNWLFRNNAVSGRDESDVNEIPLFPTENSVEPSFLSLKPSDRDYMRVAPNGPFAPASDGTFLGALPPGPAPPEGDWFTRLQERWKVAITLRRDEPITPPAVPEATSNDSSDSTPQGSSRRSVTATLVEPPPLDKWLKGRKILTVKQDGSAMFTKIQDALDALKSGQVVEVLDKGPYREQIQTAPPDDTALVSRCQTEIHAPTLVADDACCVFAPANGFRLLGIAFIDKSTEPTDASAAFFKLLAAGNVWVSDCLFDASRSTMAERRLFHTLSVDARSNAKVMVFESVILGGLRLAGNNSGQIQVKKSCIRLAPHRDVFIRGYSSEPMEAILELNVIHSSDGNSLSIGTDTNTRLSLRLLGNTIVSSVSGESPGVPALGAQASAAADQLVAERNIFVGHRRFTTLTQSPASIPETWQLKRNAISHVDPHDDRAIPLAENETKATPEFFSREESDRNYMRVKPTGAFSVQPDGTFIGALPPGPAPPEGDWFTRLQERWKVAITLRRDEPITPPAVPEATSNDSSDSTPPGSSRRSVTATLEPPPLEEWLKDREILTVKQDGSAMFTKIQDALDKAKPGQVVEILDRGPYREKLHHYEADDLGVISRVGSVIVPSEYKQVDLNGTPLMVVHVFKSAAGIRMHGLRFEFDHAIPVRGISIRCPGAVVEHCVFRFAGRLQAEGASVVQFESGEETTWTVPTIVRDCEFLSGGIHAYSYQESPLTASVIIYRNLFAGEFIGRSYAVNVNPNWQAIWIRENVFAGDRPANLLRLNGGEPPTGRKVHILNNTFLHADEAILVAYAPPYDGVLLENNLFAAPAFNFQTPGMRTKAIASWQLRNNWFAQPRDLAEDDLRTLGDTNLIGPLNFLSTDESHRDFLRLPATSPAATGGAGGDQPTYLGALPPGPAPPDGDWFTRLMERWKAVREE